LNPKPRQVIQSIKRLDNLGPGPDEVGQGDQNVLHLRRHSQKTRITQPQKIFS